MEPQPPNKPIRIFYAAGPGDVIGTYRSWRAGIEDPSEVARTYSGQFFDVCRSLGAEAYVVASHHRLELLNDGWVTIEHAPDGSKGHGGIGYHLRQIRRVLRLMFTAWRFNADVALFNNCEHEWILTPLHLLGVKVVPLLHCALWPPGNRSGRLSKRIVLRLNGWFWRNGTSATICVSPECARQVAEIAGNCKQVVTGLCSYRKSYLDLVPEPAEPRIPFHVMFAGRIETAKGIYDLLAVAEILEKQVPAGFVFEVCGRGSASVAFAAELQRRALPNVRVLGKLTSEQMAQAYARCHAVVVPTKSTGNFAEGFNQVVAEAVLAGRPVVTSRVCPALELVEAAAVEVAPDNVVEYAEALIRLSQDRAYYDKKRAACAGAAQQFYDPSLSWGAAVEKVLRSFQGSRAPLAIVRAARV